MEMVGAMMATGLGIFAQALVVLHHGQIASFAADSYATDGRGAIVVRFPALRPGTRVSGRMMQFFTLAQLETLVSVEEDGGLLVMVESYDPATQFVVMAAIEEGVPVSIKMRLSFPMVAEEPQCIH